MKKAFIQLHIAVFLAGFTGILGRLISLNEGLLVWWRLLISAATMWILYLYRKRITRISLGDTLKIAGIGMIAALHWVSFYGAIKYSNVSVALVCFSAVGFFTAMFEPLMLRTAFKPVDLLLGLLVIAGIIIIFHFDVRYKTGIAIGVIAAMLGAIFPICNRQLMQRMNAETLMTYELTGGWVALTLLMPWYLHIFPVTSWWPAGSDWYWLLFLSWVCSVWAFQLSANALKKISAFTVNLSYNLEPVYGILLAFFIYQENKDLGLSFYAGLACILVAVLLQTMRERRKSKVKKLLLREQFKSQK
ncbi:MAG TPA: DMT family transporter [Chitinophagaceae bacterium]|nr:DMT family transporter [Chitinophagaceae bacterium]